MVLAKENGSQKKVIINLLAPKNNKGTTKLDRNNKAKEIN